MLSQKQESGCPALLAPFARGRGPLEAFQCHNKCVACLQVSQPWSAATTTEGNEMNVHSFLANSAAHYIAVIS